MAFLNRTPSFSKQRLLVVAAVFAAIGGGYLVFTSFAANTVLVVIEGDKMRLPKTARAIKDPKAVNRRAAALYVNGSAKASFIVPDNSAVSSIMIRARGTACPDVWPIMTVYIDGHKVRNIRVNSAKWAKFRIERSVPAGTHQLILSFSNDASSRKLGCDRNLFVDATTFYGARKAATQPIYWGARVDGDVYGRSGDAPWDSITWDKFEAAAGKKVSIIHFGQPAPWQQAFSATPFNLAVARGAIPLVSVNSSNTSLVAITNGDYDTSIRSWLTAVASWSKPFFLRWDWEMNGGWFSWGAQAKADPTAYVSAWRHIHDLASSQGASNITWVWCPNTIFNGSTDLNSLYPGDNYVDWTCMDGYNWGTNPLKPDSWLSFSQVFNSTYAKLLDLAPTKPLMIAETSSSGYGGDKAAWINDALGDQLPNHFSKVRAIVWFNWNIPQGSGRLDWPIESSDASRAAFSEQVNKPYYLTNLPSIPAAGAQVPIP